MTWLAWRHQRTETLIAAAILALLAAWLVPTGLHIASLYHSDGIGACVAHETRSCTDTLVSFDQRTGSFANLGAWLQLAPGVLAILLAAPLVIELEQGTFRLAWTQSITRRRWLTTRIALSVLATLGAALALSLLLTWWRGPLDHFHGRIDSEAFGLEGTVPLGYALFAVALVVAAGAVLRRTLPTVVVALVAFVALQVAFITAIRQHYAAPLTAIWREDTPGPGLRNAWVLSQGSSDAHGHALHNATAIFQTCARRAPTRGGSDSCLVRHGVFSHAVYQPASRFWLFQSIETAIFVGLAAALLAFAAWWIRRRVS
jgi:hypothetical protein